MPDDKDFWKDLLGEAYDEELFKDLDTFEHKNDSEFAKPQTDQPFYQTPSVSDETKPVPPVDSAANDDLSWSTFAPQSSSLRQEQFDIPNQRSDMEDTQLYDIPKGKPSRRRQKNDPDNFEVNFDFDKEYEDGREHAPIKRNREKRTGCLGGILYFVFILAVSLGIACFAWIAATDVLALGKDDAVVEVTLPESMFSDKEVEVTDDDGNVTGTQTIKAADIDELASMLHDDGLIKYEWLFKFYAKYSSADEKVAAGTYELNTKYDYRAIVTGMTASGGVKVEIDVTIPEGYTMLQIFDLMDENGVATADELKSAAETGEFDDYEFIKDNGITGAKRLEGYLFPDTYTFYVGDEPERVIRKLLSNFENKWTSEYEERANYLGYSLNDIINIASMIEKEAGSDEERSTIASVIYNRLNSNSLRALQIDATIFYAIEGTDKEFSTDIDSPYNTYLYEGLPVGPISNPGIASIRAALYPDDTYYYYYALGTEGTHRFFEDYDPFNEFVNSDEYGG